MLRPVLFAIAVAALVAPVQAADPDISGNWLLTYSTGGGFDRAFSIIKVEMKGGKPTASTIYTPFKGLELAVTGFEVGNGKTIKFNTSVGWSFEGTLEADGKSAVGNFGVDLGPNRAKLMRTDKTELTPTEAVIRTEPPAPAAETQTLMTATNTLRIQARLEKDADKKKELTEKADAAQKEFEEKQPGLLRETLAKHADTPFAMDAAMDLLRAGTKSKVTPEEAEKLFTQIENAAAPYGIRYSQAITGQILDNLASQKGLEVAAAAIAERLSKTFAADAPATYQSRVLSAYKTALESSSVPNKDATLKTITASLTKLETHIDAEYMKKVPP